MAGFLADVRETLVPGPGTKDGPLPPMLVSLTVVTGLVDSFSYLVLGHVFVANMTGNVVFVAFALAGAGGFSVASSVTAIAAFLVGGLAAGRASSRLGKNGQGWSELASGRRPRSSPRLLSFRLLPVLRLGAYISTL
jgi:hypothetical protein